MDQDITRYLNDHLAGSSAAILLIQELAESYQAPEARDFFFQLKEEVKDDRLILEDLFERIGKEPSVLIKMAGVMAARITSLKLMWEKIEPGKLGLLEGLEMLELGVEGKRLLWKSLREIAIWFPEWEGIDFEKLDLRAIQQRRDIEFWRINAAKNILANVNRRSGILVK
ncbi:MAG: hypothetical protein V4727_02040 [Verrucomicrobiota bacterium]